MKLGFKRDKMGGNDTHTHARPRPHSKRQTNTSATHYSKTVSDNIVVPLEMDWKCSPYFTSAFKSGINRSTLHEHLIDRYNHARQRSLPQSSPSECQSQHQCLL